MKYRTSKVRLRQQLSVIISIMIVVVASSLISVNAIAKSDRIQKTLEASLNQPERPTVTNSSNIPGLWVTGDSVILGIRYELAQTQPIDLINARVGRQAQELITAIEHDISKVPNSPIILNLGNNNRLTEPEVIKIFDLIKNQPQIIVVNTAVPRGWRDENDALIAKYAEKYPQASVVDWRKISDGHPEYFAPDGVHLVPEGIKAYVSAILSLIQAPEIK